jgi:nitrile hydratase
MQQHDHSHDHDHAHGSELDEMQLRVRALKTILLEDGLIEPAALDELIETYETRIGPRNGARVVAKAWVDPRIPRTPARGRHGGDRRARFRRAQ